MKQQPLMQKKPEAPKPTERPPEVLSLALGKTTGGLHCVALLVTEGLKVIKATVLAQSRDASVVEEEWEARSYPALYHGEVPKVTPVATFASGTALALVQAPKTLASRRQAVLLEVEGEKVVEQRILYDGGKLDAWQELADWAARHLLVEAAAVRRKRQA